MACSVSICIANHLKIYYVSKWYIENDQKSIKFSLIGEDRVINYECYVLQFTIECVPAVRQPSPLYRNMCLLLSTPSLHVYLYYLNKPDIYKLITAGL